MYQPLPECKTHAENMQNAIVFVKHAFFKSLENLQTSVNMVDILDISGEYSVKCVLSCIQLCLSTQH